MADEELKTLSWEDLVTHATGLGITDIPEGRGRKQKLLSIVNELTSEESPQEEEASQEEAPEEVPEAEEAPSVEEEVVEEVSEDNGLESDPQNILTQTPTGRWTQTRTTYTI